MKITNHIELSGPLSRNRSLKALKKGDTVNVRILSRTDSRTAELDLLGNRVRAHFRNDVPDRTVLRLRIAGNSRGMLVFAIDGNQDGVFESEHQFLLIPGMDRYLSAISGPVPDMFSVIKNFIFHLRTGKGSVEVSVLNDLLKKFPSSRVSFLSFVISRRGVNDLALLVYDLLMKEQRRQEEKDADRDLSDILDSLTKEELSQLAVLAGDPHYRQLVVDDFGTPVIVEIVEDVETVAVRFSLSSAGEIQIVGRKTEDAIGIDIYMEKKYFSSQFDLKRATIERRLVGISRNITVRTYDLSEVHATLSRYAYGCDQKDAIDFTV